jgi:hypothetical protein
VGTSDTAAVSSAIAVQRTACSMCCQAFVMDNTLTKPDR